MAHIALIFTFAGITDNLILFNLITPHAIHHTLPCNMPYMLLLYHMYIIFVRHTHPLGIKKALHSWLHQHMNTVRTAMVWLDNHFFFY